MADATYQPKVYRKQGGDEFVVASGGKFTAESGGEVQMDEGSFFDLAGSTVYAVELLAAINSGKTTTVLNTTVLSALNSALSPAYGYFQVVLDTGISLASVMPPSGVKGAIIEILGSDMVADANLILNALSATGISIVNNIGSSVSTVNLSAACFLKMVCTATDVWSIVEKNDSATVQPIA